MLIVNKLEMDDSVVYCIFLMARCSCIPVIPRISHCIVYLMTAGLNVFERKNSEITSHLRRLNLQINFRYTEKHFLVYCDEIKIICI